MVQLTQVYYKINHTCIYYYGMFIITVNKKPKCCTCFKIYNPKLARGLSLLIHELNTICSSKIYGKGNGSTMNQTDPEVHNISILWFVTIPNIIEKYIINLFKQIMNLLSRPCPHKIKKSCRMNIDSVEHVHYAHRCYNMVQKFLLKHCSSKEKSLLLKSGTTIRPKLQYMKFAYW